MATFFERLAYLTGRKSLYDLHPELLDRVPLQRTWADEADRPSGYASAKEDFERSVWVRKAVNAWAENIAPLRIEVINTSNDEVVPGHPLALLLESVNDTMAASDLWRVWATDMGLGGECGFELVKNGAGRYVEIWPRPGEMFGVRVDKARRRYGGIIGYRLDDQHGKPYELEPDEFIHFKFYNPSQPYRGIAPIRAVALGVLIDLLAQAWSRMFFRNSARPDIAIIAPQGLTRKERDELLGRFKTRFQGFEHAHEPMVLEEAVTDVKTIGHAPVDIAWMEQRKLSREEILAIYGVPPEIAGVGQNTYENLFNAQRVMWLFTLKPLVGFRDDQLTEWSRRVGLLSTGERVQTDLDEVEVLRADHSSLSTIAQAYWMMGVPFNEINERLGLGFPDDLPGGNIGYIPFNLVPAGSNPISAVDVDVTRAVQNKQAEPAIPYNSDMHKAIWLLFKARTDPIERTMKRLLKKAFQEQQGRVLEVVRAADQPNGINEGAMFNKEAEAQKWADDFRAFYMDTVNRGGTDAVEQVQTRGLKQGLGITFDLTDPNAVQAVEETLYAFAEEVSATTWVELLRVLEVAVEDGWSISMLADEISSLYVGFKGVRAEMIARTETTRAYNAGANEGYRQSGIEKRQWMAALDNRTRESHIAAHGQERYMGRPFDVGGFPMEFPGDPSAPAGEVVNCRCTIVPVVE